MRYVKKRREKWIFNENLSVYDEFPFYEMGTLSFAFFIFQPSFCTIQFVVANNFSISLFLSLELNAKKKEEMNRKLFEFS